jgi:hypothetical protein
VASLTRRIAKLEAAERSCPEECERRPVRVGWAPNSGMLAFTNEKPLEPERCSLRGSVPKGIRVGWSPKDR